MSIRRCAPLPMMVDSSVDCSSGDCLIAVRAQIMGWDERYSGWFPLDGGGLSEVNILQRFFRPTSDKLLPSDCSSSSANSVLFEYTLFGRRIKDSKLLLQLRVVDDVNFCQMMPTFQSWQIGPYKFGLKFLVSSEAAKFRWRLQKAVEHTRRCSKSSSADSCTDVEDLEDDVFMPVELPTVAETSACNSSCAKTPTCSKMPKSAQSQTCSDGPPSEPSKDGSSKVGQRKKWYFMKFLDYHSSDQNLSAKRDGSSNKSKRFGFGVVCQAPVAHPDPRLRRSICTVTGVGPPWLLSLPCDSMQQLDIKRHSMVSTKVLTAGLQPLLISQRRSQTSLKGFVRREQCRHCKTYYSVDPNSRGCCPNDPDPLESLMRRLSCFSRLTALLRCHRNAEEPPAVNVCCKCAWRRSRYLRWLLITIITMFLPCVWCYLPLKTCQKACRHRCLFKDCHKSTLGSCNGSPNFRCTMHAV